jgi:hypothetical protein
VKFLSHPRVETRISHTAKNRNCAVSLVRKEDSYIPSTPYTPFCVLMDGRTNNFYYIPHPVLILVQDILFDSISSEMSSFKFNTSPALLCDYASFHKHYYVITFHSTSSIISQSASVLFANIMDSQRTTNLTYC